MKKILILILIILLGVMCYNTVTGGMQIAGFSVMGISDIKKENENLDKNIEQITTLQETDYQAKIAEIRAASKEMLSKKNNYDELKKYSTEQELANAGKSEQYNVEVLWTKIGNYATENGVTPKMEILSSSTNTKDANDLKITATGNYVELTDFIRDLEDDAKLGFTIEEFEMIPSGNDNGSTLQATFKVKDIFINQNTITTTSSSTLQSNEDSYTKSTENLNTNNINGNNTNNISTNTQMQNGINTVNTTIENNNSTNSNR